MLICLLLLDVDEDDIGFHMDVQNGSMPEDGRCNNNYGIKTRVVLSCNSTVQWTNNDLSSFTKVAYLEEAEPCEVKLTFIPSGLTQ